MNSHSQWLSQALDGVAPQCRVAVRRIALEAYERGFSDASPKEPARRVPHWHQAMQIMEKRDITTPDVIASQTHLDMRQAATALSRAKSRGFVVTIDHGVYKLTPSGRAHLGKGIY